MVQTLNYLQETASQTAGPYVHIGLIPHQAGFDIFDKNFSHVLTTPQTKGEHIILEGRVFDGSGAQMKDVLLEIWQANADGKYNSPIDQQDKPVDETFRGWGRTGTDFETGVYSFETIKPGSIPGRNAATSAPHINMWLVARGINIGLNTRVYFSDEAKANAADPVLGLIEWKNRVPTLIAERSERDGKVIYTFDIHIQGDKETVFFDV